MIIEGYAIVFDSPASHVIEEGKSFTETIKRGALNSTNMDDVPLRYNHKDGTLLLARTRNQSLRLLVDDYGLKITATLIDTQSNRDLYAAIKAGLIDKMSFAFSVPKGGDTWSRDGGNYRREINAIERLGDVSVVDTPFYDQTTIYARSLALLDSEIGRLDSLLELRKRKLKFRLEKNI